jgi:hypothetical protein
MIESKIATRVRRPVRADFELLVDEPDRKIRIIDQDRGSMSVTNDLERVLVEVSHHLDRALPDYDILYRDSTGTWDRVIVKADDAFAHTFLVSVQPGPREPQELRDDMVRIRKAMT